MDTRGMFGYLAGILDGEGCLRLRQNGKARGPSVVVRMTNEEVIRWLERNFGGTVTSARPNARCEIAYTWTLLHKETIVELLSHTCNYLIAKKAHAVLLIEFCRRFPTVPDSRRIYGYTDEAYAEMEKYAQLFTVLNATGPNSATDKVAILRAVA